MKKFNMRLIDNRILFQNFVLAVCTLRVSQGQDSSRSNLWEQNGHGEQISEWGPEHNEWARPKLQYRRSTPTEYSSSVKCGVHEQDPTSDNLFLKADKTLPGEWPWLVALFHSNADELARLVCGASLIDDRFAITAAHCLHDPDTEEPVRTKYVFLLVGTRDISTNTYNSNNVKLLTAIHVHEEYDPETKINDIALLALKEPVIYSRLLKPVCLWEGNDDQEYLVNIGQYGTVVGWGDTGDGESLETPQRIDVPITSAASCHGSGRYSSITYNNFCAGWNNQEICNGFNGSGLYIEQKGRWRLRGLISNTQISDSGDVQCNFPVIYTDVAKYGEWISDTLFYWSQILTFTSVTYVPVDSFYGPSKPDKKKYAEKVAWNRQCSVRDELNPLVIGGQDTGEHDWPWHVAIYHNEHIGSSSSIRYKCGGSLISYAHVLTAAHCVTNKLTKQPVATRSINIYMGTHNIKTFSDGIQIKLVQRMAIHQEYNLQTQYKDIAVLKLNSPAEFTAAVRPVCLWPKEKKELTNVEGKFGSVVGWGYDEYGLLADELMLTKLPVVSELTCLRSHAFYTKYTNNFTYCAGLLRDTSVCNGDSGGGMVFKMRSGSGTDAWFLRGIVSFRPATDNLCDSSRYVIFTDVAKYLDWITDFVSQEN